MEAVLLLVAVIGVLAGWRFKLSHRAWADWRRAVAAVAGLRRVFWRHARWSALWVAVAVAAVLWLVR